MPPLTGWEVTRTWDGNIRQAGVKGPARHNEHLDNAQGFITRAVVLATYFTEEDSRNGFVEGKQRTVSCDVRTYGRHMRELFKVPVLQKEQGLFDEDIYIPRHARQHIDGGDMLGRASEKSPPTPAEKLDGDHVLIGFLDNDPQQPVVLPFVMPHPRSNYAPKAVDGRIRRIRHNGTSMEFDKNGNFTIDARGAAKEILGPRGTEESNSGIGGKVLLITKDGSGKLTSVHLNEKAQVLLGSDPATPSTEPVVLGNVDKQLMAQLFIALSNLRMVNGAGVTSPPLNILEFKAIFDRFAAGDPYSDFIFARKSN